MQNQTPINPYIEEDEIDLKELFDTILKYKFKIAIFVFVVTSITIAYSLSMPNIYESKTILSPTEKDSAPNLGGLGALAGFAGINIGGGGKVSVVDKMNVLLQNYTFNKRVIKKHHLLDKLLEEIDETKSEDDLMYLLQKGKWQLYSGQ